MVRVIETYSGNFVDPLAMRAEDIRIEDIAHSLSMKTRFSGHGRIFCSIAEHSVNVSLLVDEQHTKTALFHDGSEAYLPDVPTPLKEADEFAWFRDVEDDLQSLIWSRFDCPAIDREELKLADVIMLAAEAELGLDGYYTSEHWAWVRRTAENNSDLMGQARALRVGRDPEESEELFLSRWLQVSH